MKRVWVESSRTANACSLRIEVTMAADIVDEGSSCHVAGCFDGIREWDGAQGAPFNPQPRSKHEIAGDQRDHNPTQYPACRVVTSSDRVQGAAGWFILPRLPTRAFPVHAIMMRAALK